MATFVLFNESSAAASNVEALAPYVSPVWSLNATRNSVFVRSIGESKHAAPNRDVVMVPFHEEGFGIIVKS